jgi:hypothetical protein
LMLPCSFIQRYLPPRRITLPALVRGAQREHSITDGQDRPSCLERVISINKRRCFEKSSRDPTTRGRGLSAHLPANVRRFTLKETHHTPLSARVMVGQNHERKEVIPVAVYCFTQLIQPGKREEAKAIFEEIQESRRSEYEAPRRRLGIREEKVWFQSLPQGDMAVVYWEGDDPRASLQKFASSEDPFDDWLKERGREVYHCEPSQTLEADEQVFEAEVG